MRHSSFLNSENQKPLRIVASADENSIFGSTFNEVKHSGLEYHVSRTAFSVDFKCIWAKWIGLFFDSEKDISFFLVVCIYANDFSEEESGPMRHFSWQSGRCNKRFYSDIKYIAWFLIS